MPQPGRSEVAHVLFRDIVEFSREPLAKQTQLIEELQDLVRATSMFKQCESAGEVSPIPTGDGMALVYLRDPSAPAECAVELAAKLRGKSHLRVRMGIHSGPI